MERHPTEAEIDAVFNSFDLIAPYINQCDGTIIASAWQEIYTTLKNLSEFELWLGLCNLESAIFDSAADVTHVHTTLFELFHIAYEQGVDAL